MPLVGKYFRNGYSALHAKIITLSRGKLWTRMRGGEIILLTTTGRKSGVARTHPLLSVRTASGWVIAGSNTGQDTNPAWVHNVRANPVATVGDRGKKIHATVREVSDTDERERLFGLLVAAHDGFAGYQSRTTRQIPVFVVTGE